MRYGIGWFCLKDQVAALEDFQANIGEHLKVYPFLFQKNSTHIGPAETFQEVGRSTNGVVYFEQPDSWGAGFPVARNKAVRIKIKIMDSFGRSHTRNFWVPRFTLQEARSYNPSFGLTLTAMRGQAEPIELPADRHGNVVPSSLRRSA